MIALVVDDSAAMRHIQKKSLEGMGWQVEVANDGQVALQKLQSMDHCDLLLTDWHMPIMDGLELVRSVRKGERHSKVRIVMVTSDGVLDSVEQALAAGADDFVMKPFSAEALSERIGEVMSA